MPATFHDFSAQPLDLKPICGLPATDIPDQVERVLNHAPGYSWEPSIVTRETYLDLAELLVRAAADWQDENGATIDPHAGSELGQTSPRFVSSAAVLLSLGRIPELREKVFQSMDWCCTRLSTGMASAPDFWLRELMTAWWALESVEAPESRRAAWREQLTSLDSERHNQVVERPDKPIESLHNWVVYASAGEGMRELAGLIPEGRPSLCGSAFWEKYMSVQVRHFSAHGMYRDPNDPLTYDMTTRLQAAVPLIYGLETPLRPVYEELLRRGALAQLLYVTPDGLSPFGGRSNSFHLQECILAALGEIEARRYQTARPALAGAFKRQAHLGGAAMERWLRAQPHRHLKNMFPPESGHGCEGYAGYAVYSLFAASCLVLAAQFADESIPEAPMPAELGGYVVEFAPAFHKVFAACGGTQVEIDTAADLHYDATGLGRLLHRGLPPELALAMPIPVAPYYTVLDPWQAKQQCAIGPQWRGAQGEWHSLAAISEGLAYALEVHAQSAGEVAFSICWRHEEQAVSVWENYVLREKSLDYEARVEINGVPAEAVRLVVPMLVTDGEVTSETRVEKGQATVSYRGAHYEVRWPGENETTLGEPIANRNGVYRPLYMTLSPRAQVEFRLGSR